MPDPRKKQILERIKADLDPLVPATIRKVRRGFAAEAISDTLPMVQFFDGEEVTVAKDATKWTCRFPVFLHIVFAKVEDKDLLVSEVQKKIEGDMTLNNLALVVDGGNEKPSQAGPKQTTFQTTLRYTIEYTRKIGDPTLAS